MLSEKITRYGPATEVIFHEEIVDIQKSFQHLHDSFDNYSMPQFSSSLDHHLNATKCIILSLIASEQKKQINFKELIAEEFYSKKYRIS